MLKPLLLSVCCFTVVVLPAVAAEPTPALPFGLELGVTPCQRGVEAISGVLVPGSTQAAPSYVARLPCQLFPRANRIQMQCAEGVVAAVKISLSKGGAGSPAMFDAFKSLRQKYQLVQGTTPTDTDGACVTFKSKEGLVKLDADAFSSELSVEYLLEAVERRRQAAGL